MTTWSLGKGARRTASEICVVSALVASCHSTIKVELPVDPSTKSLIIGFDDHQSPLQVVAVRRDAPMNLPSSKNFGGRATYTVLLYDAPLDELSPPEDPNETIPEGVLTADTEIGTRRSLPSRPDHVLEADATDDGVGSWLRTATAALGKLTTFHYHSGTDLCPSFKVTRKGLDLFGGYSVVAMVPLDEANVLAISVEQTLTRNAFARISRTGTAALSPIDGFIALTAYRASDGKIWLAGYSARSGQGQVFGGDPVHGWQSGPSSLFKEKIRWIDGPHDGSPFELFTMSAEGNFEHFDGTNWEPIFSSPVEKDDLIGGVAWVGRDEAIAFPPDVVNLQSLVLYYNRSRSSVPTSYQFPPGQYGVPTAITALSGYSDLIDAVETREGFLVTFDKTGYRNIAAPAVDEARVIAPFRQGIVTFGKGGIGIYYSKQLNDLCQPIQIDPSLQPLSIAPVGRGLAVSGHADAGPVPVLFLDPID